MKNWIKRIICLCLVLALCAGFAGCRKSGSGDGSLSDLSSEDALLGNVELDDNSSEEGTESDTTSDGTTDSSSGNSNNNSSNATSNTSSGNSSNNSSNVTDNTSSSNDSGVTNADVELPVRDMGGRTFTFAAPSWSDTVNVDSDWVKALEKKYNCKFENLNLNNDYTTLYSSILAGNPIADVVVFNYTNFYPAVKSNLLLELKSSENINYQDSSCFIPKAQEKLTTVNGKLYGAIDTYAFRNMLVYNRSIITGDDDLLTLSNNGQLTWDKLYEILQKVVASGKKGIAGELNEEGILQAFILANGSSWFTRDGLNFTYCLDNQNTRDALSYVQKLKASNLTMPLDGGNYLYGQTQFVKGRVGMMIVDGYNLDYIAKNAKFDYGVVMLPNKDGSKGLVDLTEFECYSIPSTVKNPEDVQLIFAAWKQAEEANNEGKQWSLENKTDDLDTKDAEVIKAYAKRIENADGIIDYRNVLVDYYGDDINTQEKKCLYSEITVQAYLERVGKIYKKAATDFNNG